MQIKAQELLRAFAKKYPAARKPLQRWKSITEGAIWKTPADVKRMFASVSFVGKAAVFNIGGNKWRLLTHILYPDQAVVITRVLTHKQYDDFKIE